MSLEDKKTRLSAELAKVQTQRDEVLTKILSASGDDARNLVLENNRLEDEHAKILGGIAVINHQGMMLEQAKKHEGELRERQRRGVPVKRIEVQHRLDKINQTLVVHRSLIESLEKAKADALSRGDAEAALDANKRLQQARESLPELEIVKTATEAKLRTFQANEKAASDIRVQIAKTWDEIKPLVDSLIKKREEIADILKQIPPLQAQIDSLAPKHLELVGEPLEPPVLWQPNRFQYLPGIQLTPLIPWRYVSESEKQEAAAKREAEEREEQLARVKLASEHAPICKKCEQKMMVRADVGRDGETAVGSGRWSYECRNCKIITTDYVAETVKKS